MKLFRILATVLALAGSLICPRLLLAADPTPTATTSQPIVVSQDRNDRDLQRDLRGVPPNIKTLIMTFDQTREKFLQQQSLLQIRLRNASTSQERDQVRQQLQANRQDFLTDLKSYRDTLRNDLQSLKGKIGNAEFGRIIDAAHGGGHRHRGQ
jgi:hypothetical protein